ncbi:hypothetical protein [Geoalkalibacter sp.]|uniref:hypothetical protein n=1 Tax=Geoalkalibacter sp. TaxID=3041440 RepID=UPI00272E4BF9|nr:hypothetical protein [Geoalkalibacter sp.]
MTEAQKNETSEIILRMREALAAESDLALAIKIGSKSKGLVSNWRTKGHVPDGAIGKVSQISGKSFQYLKTGIDTERSSKVAEGIESRYVVSGVVRKISEDQEELLAHYESLPSCMKKALLFAAKGMVDGVKKQSLEELGGREDGDC